MLTWLLLGLFAGLYLALMWPGNPASSGLVAVSNAISSSLGRAA